MRRFGFSMIELIFVIVIMGIIGKFGVEFLAQAYKSFIFSNVNHTLQADSEMAVEAIASRLQYRIKDSVIARDAGAGFLPIGSASTNQYNIIEWVGSDIDGFRGDALPFWSGIIDISNSTANSLNTPGTNPVNINNLIGILSNNSGTTMANSAIYFIGSNSDVTTDYGWSGAFGNITNQNGAMHPISGNGNNFIRPTTGNFTGQDVYEYYQLAWTAYAVGIANYNAGTNTGTLTLWYDYQPWEGDTYLTHTDGTATKSVVLMENVSTFQFMSAGSVIKIQVCTNSDLVEDYSLCKEKTIF